MRFLGASWMEARGDTIVEVLISLAIISLVLVTAYASARHSTQETQSTQEHSSALQLAQGQVEFLRAAKTLPPGSTCFNQSGAATSGADCTVTLGGGASYKLGISFNAPTRVYTVQATWSTLSGKTNDDGRVTVYYKPVQ